MNVAIFFSFLMTIFEQSECIQIMLLSKRVFLLKDNRFQGRERLVKFTQMIREFEKVDPEILRLKDQIRSHRLYLPPILSSTNDILI